MAKHEVNNEFIDIETIPEAVKQETSASTCSVGFHSSLLTANFYTFTAIYTIDSEQVTLSSSQLSKDVCHTFYIKVKCK